MTTYRLQFNKDFTFKDATLLVPYLHQLGITHVYASPIFRADPGSTHGYDICDHNELNPEIGTREEFDVLDKALRAHEMSLVLDFVPNHMSIADTGNWWWRDVLENGPASPYARFFDIEWKPLKPELENKVLLPFLGNQYGHMLEGGEFSVQFSEGVFTLHFQGTFLPLGIRTTRPILTRASELVHEAPPELISIITALDYLPSRDETDPEKIVERTREKGVIRERLIRLCSEQSEVEEAIQSSLREWNDPSFEGSFDRLDSLLSSQAYRLSYWRVAAEEINYRRFFDVNTLAAVNMEFPEVFEETHQLLLELVAAGAVSGIRIDHIDGLAFPLAYLQQLREKVNEVSNGRQVYIVVEKIVGAGEVLRKEWPVEGTTGYEFANQVVNVLLNGSSGKQISKSYENFIDDWLDYQDVVYKNKRLIMQVSMASEVNVLGTLLARLSESNRWYRDFTINSLTTAIREVIACFSVYRSYVVPGTPADDADVKVITQAIAMARRKNPAVERTVFDFVKAVLLPHADNPHPVDEALRHAFVLKFQQCSGPIMAKGVEDTTFYVYNRLVALNEVGGEPGTFGISVDEFHKHSVQRLADSPQSMLATSTHDTKRSEDVRARIAALSVLSHEWSRAVKRWQTINQKYKQKIDGELAPDSNEEYFIYQTLLGTWPLEPMSAKEKSVYIERIQEYMVKALHEAKVNSSWIEPNVAWDQAVKDFIEKILSPAKTNRFPAVFGHLAEQVAPLGMVNSLTQTVLKLTVPGMPDTYQGTELWDFSLVDPDNRRAVDYTARKDLLNLMKSTPVTELFSKWRTGGIKLFVTQKLLQLRKQFPDLFAQGTYEPITPTGRFEKNLIVFERRTEDHVLLVAVPRLSAMIGHPPLGDLWFDTQIDSSRRLGKWKNVFTDEDVSAEEPLLISELFQDLPFAVLIQPLLA